MELNGRKIADDYYSSSPKISYIFVSSEMTDFQTMQIPVWEHVFESFLNEHRFNFRLVSAYNCRKDSVKSQYASKRGKNWNKVLEEFADQDVFHLSSLEVPNAKSLAKESASLAFYKDKAANVASISGRIIWNDEWIPFNSSPADWFLAFHRIIQRERQYVWGGMNLCHSNVGGADSHYALNEWDGAWLLTVPLLSHIAKSRIECTEKDQPDWKREPFNLYWGNIISCDIFEDLNNFLAVCSKALKHSDGSIEISKSQFIHLYLSPDVQDSLCPSPKYQKTYNTILTYLIDQKLIHSGLPTKPA